MVLRLVSVNHPLLQVRPSIRILHHGGNGKIHGLVPIEWSGTKTVWNGEWLKRSKGRPGPGVDSRAVSVARSVDDAFKKLRRKVDAIASQSQDRLSHEEQGRPVVSSVKSVQVVVIIGAAQPSACVGLSLPCG